MRSIKQLKYFKHKTSFGNSKPVKKGFSSSSNRALPCTWLFKSTLDVTQINNFKKNAKATITKIVMLEYFSLFIFPPVLHIRWNRGRNNARSSDMTKRICYLIRPKFSQFQALSGSFENRKLKVVKFFFRFQGNLSKK